MQASQRGNEQRAAPPQLPPCTPALTLDRQDLERNRSEQERMERRSVVRGLILLAVIMLVGSVARAGLDRVFVHGWWRP